MSNTAPATPAIVLAGGLGTRLRPVINELPKPMAMINGKPFLHYLFVYLTRQQVSHAVLSVGYKAAFIESYFGDKYLDVNITYCREEEPLGTGGGIKKAYSLVHDDAFVLNGDTFFNISLAKLKQEAVQAQADMALALKPMKHFERYGAVECDARHRIRAFHEKRAVEQGSINGGVYYFSKKVFDKVATPEVFSFEKEVLEKHTDNLFLLGVEFDNYFVDIGVPEDFFKAQHDFKELFA